jgi:hypothetical protein
MILEIMKSQIHEFNSIILAIHAKEGINKKNESNKIAKSKQESMVQYIASSVNDTRIYENSNTEIQ